MLFILGSNTSAIIEKRKEKNIKEFIINVLQMFHHNFYLSCLGIKARGITMLKQKRAK